MIALILSCTTHPGVDSSTPTDSGVTHVLPEHRYPRVPEDTGAEVTPPNILVVLSDDIGIEASACYEDQISASRAAQPTIAGLCDDGLRFTDVWSYPLCSPTRAAMMTGRYGWRTGVGRALDEDTEPLSIDEVTIPDVLGVESALIGKWHLTGEDDPGHPQALGWSHFAGTLYGVLPDYYAYEEITDGSASQVDRYATTETVDDALAWLGERGEEPWLLWVGFHAPHIPLHAPPDDLHSVDLTGLDPDTWPLPFFQAMIEAMDTELGRLLAGVDRDNTVIIYLSDNGTRDNLNQEIYPQGHAKGTLGEGGVHVPMIIAGPGIPQGDVTEMVHAADVFATIIELAGAEVPADLEHDSVSLVPYLQDPDAGPQRELMLTELFGDVVPETLAGRAARTTEFKLIRLFTGEERLYNLRLDPTEQHDLMLSPLTSESRAAARFLGDYLDLIEAQADL